MAKRRWRRRRERPAELDLAHDQPSPELYEEQFEFLDRRSDRIHVSGAFGLDGVQTQVEIQVKGRLHHIAEHFVRCLCAMVVAGGTATLCHLVGAPLWFVLSASAAVAALAFVTGRRQPTKPSASRSHLPRP